MHQPISHCSDEYYMNQGSILEELNTDIGKPPKKKVKKFHNKCEISPKMENPPPSPYFTTILADFGT